MGEDLRLQRRNSNYDTNPNNQSRYSNASPRGNPNQSPNHFRVSPTAQRGPAQVGDMTFTNIQQQEMQIRILNELVNEKKKIQQLKEIKLKLKKTMDEYTTKGRFDQGFAEYEEKNCVICFDDYTTKNVIRKVKRCGHLFHGNCLKSWISKHVDDPKCPLCNLNIKNEDRVRK
ncbi:ring-h2 finger protein atl7-like [Stylonychia lemnae]|uniref:Ring-h2 finger protein atl7-like n=1 Tax=Stylonychia lemnae TaxID=5949 RepID=A0A078AFS5_STYLE|nr:ring-h2 finger protein atl7-like [Stylonychia lemnae]|eukprot:CDW81110.1 ring-h2 finger protein atl7-like [Stylonychia lemnae]